MTMELTHGKDDHPKAPPSQLILYLQMRSADSNDPIRIVNCNRDSDQALKIYSSIEQAIGTYGRNQKKVEFSLFICREEIVLIRNATASNRKPYNIVLASGKIINILGVFMV